MYFLPEYNNLIFMKTNKVYTYQLLAKLGLPVLSSVLLKNTEQLSDVDIKEIKGFLNANYCTVRYQYITPNLSPKRGGNLIKIDKTNIISMLSKDYYLWLMKPINRLTNQYGINIRISKDLQLAIIEIVGKGFDVSSINRGTINPHETITIPLPINWGWYNQWWKFIKISICNEASYRESLKIRKEELIRFQLDSNNSIFNNKFIPISYETLYKLLKYIELLYDCNICNDFVVSVSVDENNEFVFWDIQIPKEKIFIYTGG